MPSVSPSSSRFEMTREIMPRSSGGAPVSFSMSEAIVINSYAVRPWSVSALS